jgi:hypothetical protein
MSFIYTVFFSGPVNRDVPHGEDENSHLMEPKRGVDRRSAVGSDCSVEFVNVSLEVVADMQSLSVMCV